MHTAAAVLIVWRLQDWLQLTGGSAERGMLVVAVPIMDIWRHSNCFMALPATPWH
jgi:hypothetical protein